MADSPRARWHTWGHVVSTDMIHWKRIADALTPPPYGAPGDYEVGEDCDGTLSFTKGGPVIMFGPSCDPPRGMVADAAQIGWARPQNASDPFLTAVRATEGRLSALSVFHSKPFLYGTFAWARRALNGRKRWFPARAVGEGAHRGGLLRPAVLLPR